MFHELCNPLTMKIMALGRPLYEAERIAAVITVWVVLLCAMMGLQNLWKKKYLIRKVSTEPAFITF
jgi:hypothetical protein